MHVIRNCNKFAPYVNIVEQPASKGTRFRYECEGRFAGTIFGEKTTSLNKSFPTIEIVNHKGPALIVISCVSKDLPYWPHPYNIIGKANEISNGIYCFKTISEEMTITFNNLGIQCVKRKDIQKSLTVRRSLKIDPFNTGFSHMSNPESIDLYSLRLCFQVYLEGKEKGNFNFALKPVVSNPIYDKKTRMKPIINFISHESASVAGGTQMCILCEKVTRENIQVRFFHDDNNWQALAEFTPPGIFKQVAIVFKSPKYFLQDISVPVNAKIQLRRISDGQVSESYPFQFLPLELNQNYSLLLSDYGTLKRKRERNKTISEQLQLEAAKNINRVKRNHANNPIIVEMEPWELPYFFRKSDKFEQLLSFVETDNEEMCMFSKQPTSTASIDKRYNAYNTTFDALKKQSTFKSQLLNVARNSQHITKDKEDDALGLATLNYDNWIEEFNGTLDHNESIPEYNPNYHKNMHKIVMDPETNFINSNISDALLSEQNTNNHFEMPIKQMNNYPVTPTSDNLSKCFNISNLIKISTNITKDYNMSIN